MNYKQTCALTMDIHEQSTGKRNLNRQSNFARGPTTFTDIHRHKIQANSATTISIFFWKIFSVALLACSFLENFLENFRVGNFLTIFFWKISSHPLQKISIVFTINVSTAKFRSRDNKTIKQ